MHTHSLCRLCAVCLAALALASSGSSCQVAANLVPDPSLEQMRAPNQFGVPFTLWGGWIYEGAPRFRVGRVARTGKTSGLMVGAQGGKLRIYTPAVTVAPGRYRFSCYVRGLDVGPGQWGTTLDLNFVGDKYHAMGKLGTFGWTRLELVSEVTRQESVQARLGLWGPGRVWVDDAAIEKVDPSTPVSSAPAWGREESPIAAPGPVDAAAAVRCAECGTRAMPAWKQCPACGEPLAVERERRTGPDVRPLASFEDGRPAPFSGSGGGVARVVAQHASHGKNALALTKGYASWDGAIDWTGYDFFKADTFNPSDEPAQFYFEVRDQATTDYWTRVNYNTVVPPGRSTVIIPTDLYVGEKSRPGRPLDRARITRVVLSVTEARTPIYFDNLRLERDRTDTVKVPGLMAFSFGPGSSPPLPGFIPVDPSTQYSALRGYGLRNARIWRAYDALQPDPLYQKALCIEGGTFVVDLPPGRYSVFMNLDSPSGFWGEYQIYRKRLVRANGIVVVDDRMDLRSFTKRYFRFAETDDAPDENAFDKYLGVIFREKEFEVEVGDSGLTLSFEGANWANFLSALVVYPSQQSAAGRKYLANLRERRRFYFDNGYKRVLPNGRRDARGAIPPFVPTAAEKALGAVVWSRDWMDDVYVNATPRRDEVTRSLSVHAAAGQMEPVVFSVTPLRSLGTAEVTVTDLVGPGGARIPSSALVPGVVSHRLSRVTMEGSVYTIAPRLVMPRSRASLKKGATVTFWYTLHVPARVRAGTYAGQVRVAWPGRKPVVLALRARLYATPLDPVDVPVGPWGSTIDLPWYGEETGARNRDLFRKSLERMRAYGLTAFSGIPTLRIRGWQNGRPDIDFSQADEEMRLARAAGFKMVINYNGGIGGFDNYFQDEAAMKRAGYSDYTAFLRAVLTAVDAHARGANWLPVAYNLCDEPLGDAAQRSAANARAWREAAPPTLLTTGATSLASPKPDDPHLPLAKALRIANLNIHDEAAIQAIKAAGSDWAFYNGGSRWTYGAYMLKCARQYGMRFRLSWHWNCAAGDPFYALDCREDDYAWCVANEAGDLIPSLHFEREVRAGIDDYRAMATVMRLVKARPRHPAAASARRLIDAKLAAFRLGQRDHDALWPRAEHHAYRRKLLAAIEALTASRQPARAAPQRGKDHLRSAS